MAGVRKMDRTQIDDGMIDTLRKCLGEGMSASEIGGRIGKSRNSVLGLIDRHIKGNTDKTVRRTTDEPARDPRKGSHVFGEPSAPRRFSWEEQPSV